MSHNTHSTVGQIPGRAGLRSADRGLRIDRTPIRNPKSEIRNFAERRGISLTEVLIAMGILTVGLLGVAAIFPVAGFYMQKGEVADRGSAIAQAAFNELLTRGMLNPESWIVMVPTTTNQPNNLFTADYKADGTQYSGSFSRPFAESLREAQAKQYSPIEISQNFGSAFVIDPLGVNAFANVQGLGNTRLNVAAMPFPSGSYLWFRPGSPPSIGYAWSPWSGSFNSPIRRVTFRDTRTGWQLNNEMTDRLFRTTDDLSLELPTGQDKPSQQPITLGDLDRDGKADEPLARQSRGDYSWLATVVPTTLHGLLALANGPAGNTYEVSVVVFHKRRLPTPPGSGGETVITAAGNERMARARIVSTGLSGGEIMLERHSNDEVADQPESPFQNLKTGQWIMLCGPHPMSTDRRPQFVARWYKVLSIEKETNGIITDPVNQRLVTVRGPQWPWQPAANLTDANHLSNTLCVGIFPGAVAVHAKTVQLEGQSVWSGGADALVTSPTRPIISAD